MCVLRIIVATCFMKKYPKNWMKLNVLLCRQKKRRIFFKSILSELSMRRLTDWCLNISTRFYSILRVCAKYRRLCQMCIQKMKKKEIAENLHSSVKLKDILSTPGFHLCTVLGWIYSFEFIQKTDLWGLFNVSHTFSSF